MSTLKGKVHLVALLFFGFFLWLVYCLSRFVGLPLYVIKVITVLERTNQTKQEHYEQGPPVVQSVVSLTSLLVVKMLTVLVRTISNSQGLFLQKKCE